MGDILENKDECDPGDAKEESSERVEADGHDEREKKTQGRGGQKPDMADPEYPTDRKIQDTAIEKAFDRNQHFLQDGNAPDPDGLRLVLLFFLSHNSLLTITSLYAKGDDAGQFHFWNRLLKTYQHFCRGQR